MEKATPHTKNRLLVVSKALAKVIFGYTIIILSIIIFIAMYLGFAAIFDFIITTEKSEEITTHQTQEQTVDQSSLSEDQIKESIDKYIQSSILSLDYNEDQTEDSTYYDSEEYYTYIHYNEDSNESMLVISEYVSGEGAVQKLDIEPYSLMTNQNLTTFSYRDYIVFSVDPRDTWCDYDCSEIEKTMRRDGAKYGGIWAYNFTDDKLTHIFEYDEEDVINSNRYYKSIQDSPLVIIRYTARINDYETSYKIQTLNIVTGELKTIHEDTTL